MKNAGDALSDRMLSAYGARIWRWPEGRLGGLSRLLLSPEFRRRYFEEKALDRMLAHAAPKRVAGARVEGRLLAAMGVDLGPSRQRRLFHPAGAGGLAAASLIAGIALGGQFGPDVIGEATYAGLSESAWTQVADDITFDDEELG